MESKIIAAVLLIALFFTTPTPAVDSIQPNYGLNNGPIEVSITGVKFENKAVIRLTKSGEPDIIATNVTVNSKKQLNCTFDLQGHAAGNWNVIVANKTHFSKKEKIATLAEGFNIQYPTPTVSALEPNQGLTLKVVKANITGTYFRAGAKVVLMRNNIKIDASSVKVLSSTQIATAFDLSAAEPGTYDLKVINDDGKAGTLANAFIIGNPAPEVTAINPNLALNNETVTVMISGSNFKSGAKVNLSNFKQTIEGFEVKTLSNTLLSAKLNLVGAAPGTYQVQVTNADGKSGSLANSFQIIVKPTIHSIKPTNGFNNGSIFAEIDGSNFSAGAVVKLVGAEQMEIPGLNVKIKSSQQISCFFDLNQQPVGSYTVRVTNPDGQESSLPNGFTIEKYLPNNQELNELLKPLFFDFDKSELRPDQVETVEADLKLLQENPHLFILLGGHADERGTREYNLELSARRTLAVRQFLVDQGVDSSKISIYAYGKDYPLKKEHDESAWEFNRRVDILVWEAPPTREQGLLKVLTSETETK